MVNNYISSLQLYFEFPGGFSSTNPLNLESHTEQRATTRIYADPFGYTFALRNDKTHGSCVCTQKCSATTGVQELFGKT